MTKEKRKLTKSGRNKSKEIKNDGESGNKTQWLLGDYLKLTYFSLFVIGLVIAYFLPSGDWSTLFNDSLPDLSKLKDDPDWWLDDESKLWDILGSTKCNVEIKSPHELSLELLNGTYKIDRPVIIRFPKGARSWTEPDLWSLSSLKSKYGKSVVSVGSSDEIPLNDGQGPQKISLENYIDNFIENGTHPDNKYFYMFDRDLFHLTDLKGSIREPEALKSVYQDSSSIMFVGGALTAVTFHLHAAAWAGLIHGRKRWYLFPPSMTPPGGVPQIMTFPDWLKTYYGNPNEPKIEHLIECTQEEGDIFIVPELFHHAVINLTPIVAIGYQMKKMTSPLGQFTEKWNKVFMEKQKQPSTSLSSEEKRLIRNVYLQEARQVFHKDPPSWNLQANIALLSENSLEKLETFAPMIAREPDLHPVRQLMVHLNMEVGNLEKAKILADTALSQCPMCHSVYDIYISLLTHMEKPLKQIYHFRRQYGLRVSTSSERKFQILERMIMEASKLNLHEDYAMLKQMSQYIPNRDSFFLKLQRLTI